MKKNKNVQSYIMRGFEVVKLLSLKTIPKEDMTIRYNKKSMAVEIHPIKEGNTTVCSFTHFRVDVIK